GGIEEGDKTVDLRGHERERSIPVRLRLIWRLPDVRERRNGRRVLACEVGRGTPAGDRQIRFVRNAFRAPGRVTRRLVAARIVAAYRIHRPAFAEVRGREDDRIRPGLIPRIDLDLR